MGAVSHCTDEVTYSVGAYMGALHVLKSGTLCAG